jgi:hypothetical protein
MAGIGSCVILTTCDAAHVMQTVFDPPMPARYRQQLLWASLFSRHAGYRVNRLGAFLASHDAPSGDAAYLREARPGRSQERGQRGGRLQTAGLDPAVTFLDRLRASKIRRRRPYR